MTGYAKKDVWGADMKTSGIVRRNIFSAVNPVTRFLVIAHAHVIIIFRLSKESLEWMED